MDSALSVDYLKETRAKALADLEKKYGHDPLFGLVKQLDLLIKNGSGTTASPCGSTNYVYPTGSKAVFLKTSSEKKASPDEIVTWGTKFFELHGNEPVEATNIVEWLRESGLNLYEDDHSARVSVGKIFSQRPETFDKIKPSSKRFPMKWKLKNDLSVWS